MLVRSKTGKQSPLLCHLSPLVKYLHCSPCRQWVICSMLTLFLEQCQPLTKESDGFFLKSASADLHWSPANCSKQLRRTATSSLVCEACKNIEMWLSEALSTGITITAAITSVGGLFHLGAVKLKLNALLYLSKLQKRVTASKTVWNNPGCQKERRLPSTNDVQISTSTVPRSRIVTKYACLPLCVFSRVSATLL